MFTGLIWGGLLLATALAAQPPSLSCDLADDGNGVYLSSEGVVDLKWSLDNATIFELQATNPADPETFIARYHGTDHSSVLSGLAEGLHKFRVRAVNDDESTGPWSETLTVKVAYMPAARVRLLLILGGLVVISTAGTIIFGHFNHRKKEGAS